MFYFTEDCTCWLLQHPARWCPLKGVEIQHCDKTVEWSSSPVVCRTAENGSPLECHCDFIELQLHIYLHWQTPSWHHFDVTAAPDSWQAPLRQLHWNIMEHRAPHQSWNDQSAASGVYLHFKVWGEASKDRWSAYCIQQVSIHSPMAAMSRFCTILHYFLEHNYIWWFHYYNNFELKILFVCKYKRYVFKNFKNNSALIYSYECSIRDKLNNWE